MAPVLADSGRAGRDGRPAVTDVVDLLAWLRAQPLTEEDRRLVERHAPVVDGEQNSWAWFEGSESASEAVLRELAVKYGYPPAPPAGGPGVISELLPWLHQQLALDLAEAPHIHRRDCDNAQALGHDACNCGWPARLLAEVESKRRILQAYERYLIARQRHDEETKRLEDDVAREERSEQVAGQLDVRVRAHRREGDYLNAVGAELVGIVQVVALPYQDRPGFRQERRP